MLYANYTNVPTGESPDNQIIDRLLETNYNRNVVLIGDSYADGYTPDGNITSWIDIVKNNFRAARWYVAHEGGAGIVAKSPSGKSARELYLQAIAGVDTSIITDVIIALGYNDYPYNKDQMTTALQRLSAAISINTPSARVSIVPIGFTVDYDVRQSLRQLYSDAMHTAPLYNVAYHYYACATLDANERFSSDGIHPSGKGQEAIATQICNILRGGGCYPVYNNYSASWNNLQLFWVRSSGTNVTILTTGETIHVPTYTLKHGDNVMGDYLDCNGGILGMSSVGGINTIVTCGAETRPVTISFVRDSQGVRVHIYNYGNNITLDDVDWSFGKTSTTFTIFDV